MSDEMLDSSKFRWRRALVRAGRAERASSGLRDRVFALDPAVIAVAAVATVTTATAKSSQAAPASVPAAPASSVGAAGAGASALLWKGAALFFFTGVIVGASLVTVRSETHRSPAAPPALPTPPADSVVVEAPSVIAEPDPSPLDALPTANPAPPVVRPKPMAKPKPSMVAERHPAATATAPEKPALRERVSIAEEMRLVEAIRSTANGGRPAEALRLLEEYRVDFPSGMLAEEADVMRIEALSRLGRTAAAAELARRFLKTRADSPYVERVEQTLASLPDSARNE